MLVLEVCDETRGGINSGNSCCYSAESNCAICVYS
jgi:hypothetical protein